MMKEKLAVIFDMDGVLVDNSEVHNETWRMICDRYGYKTTKEEIKSIFGGTNKIFVKKLMGIKDKGRIESIAIEKEALYREIFDKQIKAPEGLLKLLFNLKKNNVQLAVATSGPTENLNFVLDKLDIRGFFDVLIDESFISKGKPDPEVFIVTSQKLGIEPKYCAVIEDSIYGIKAAIAAGMKVIGITTSFSPDKIKIANLVINGFDEIDYLKIKEIIFNRSKL